jgi:hypothetical protein
MIPVVAHVTKIKLNKEGTFSSNCFLYMISKINPYNFVILLTSTKLYI